jgi:hypothetical protein
MKLKFLVASLITMSFVLLSKPAWADCALTDRVYRDVANRGFELEFYPPVERPTSLNFATVRIRHTAGETLYEFYMTQSQGYGTVSLIGDDKGFRINFFNADLTTASWGDADGAEYVFIAELGAHEYSHRGRQRAENETPILGEVMWKFDRCKSDS